MKQTFLVILLLSSIISFAKADDMPTASGADLLTQLKVPNDFTLSADWINVDTGCPAVKGYYFLNLITNGEVEGKAALIQFSVQTGSEANLHRIYDAIAANVDTKGLPACLLKDVFMSQPVEVFHPYSYYLYQPISTKFCTVNGQTYGFPISSCADETDLYPVSVPEKP